MNKQDNRTVMTLDAGGTNFVFTAIREGKEIITPITLPAQSDNLNNCLTTIIAGFKQVMDSLDTAPVAISFAFPGPADYERGIIGDLPNFSSFRGGIALKSLLEEEFGMPVFINNDGNLFAYGEALCGFLPNINRQLKEAGNPKQYKNLLGITLGTGFGAGVVIDGILLSGDNGCGGDVWLGHNKKHTSLIAEESVSIRAVKRVYSELTNEPSDQLSPEDIFNIAEGTKEGNQAAALKSFEVLGEVLGNSLAQALNMVDGLVVIGGGVSGAIKYIMPSVIKELRSPHYTSKGEEILPIQSEVYDLTDEKDTALFLKNETCRVKVPFSDKEATYHFRKKTGIGISFLGTNRAISLGAYAFALQYLDKRQDC